MISTFKLWLLRPKLRNQDDKVRRQAVEAIGKIGTRGAVKVLLGCLGSRSDVAVMSSAAAALAEIGTAPAIDGLVAALGGENREGLTHIVRALSGVNDPRAIPGLLQALAHETAWDSASTARAMSLLKKHADDRVRAGLREAMKHNGSQVRWHVVEALGALHDAESVDALVASLDDDTLCTAAAAALQNIGSKRAVPGLVKVLKSRPQIQRGPALEALASLGWQPANTEEVVLKELAEGNYVGAAFHGAPAVGQLIRELKIGSTVDAIQALTQIGDPRAVPALVAAGKEDRQHAAAVCRALGTFRDPRSLALLVEVLAERDQDPDGERRAAAAWAIGQIGEPKAGPALRAAMDCHDDNVLAAAAEALGKLGDKHAIPQLVAALNHKPCADHRWCWHVRQAAAEALGKIGDMHAVKPLILALKHEGWHEHAKNRSSTGGGDKGKLLGDVHSTEVDQAIANALAKLNHPQTVDVVAQLLKEEQSPILGIVDVLERLPDPKATDILKKILHGPEGDRRCHAAQALARRKDPEGTEFLIKTLQPVVDEWSEGRMIASPEIEFAARYLGELAEPAAVGPLLVALKGMRGPARTNLRTALHRIVEHAADRVEADLLRTIETDMRGEDGELVSLAHAELQRRQTGALDLNSKPPSATSSSASASAAAAPEKHHDSHHDSHHEPHHHEGGMEVTCTCGRQYHVQPELAGKRLKCRHCGHVFVA